MFLNPKHRKVFELSFCHQTTVQVLEILFFFLNFKWLSILSLDIPIISHFFLLNFYTVLKNLLFQDFAARSIVFGIKKNNNFLVFFFKLNSVPSVLPSLNTGAFRLSLIFILIPKFFALMLGDNPKTELTLVQ